MKKLILIVLSLTLTNLILSATITEEIAFARTSTQLHVEMLAGANTIDSSVIAATVEAINGDLHFLRAMLTNSCLPLNEASLSELNNNSYSSAHFVPAQLGFWMGNAILSVPARDQFPEMTNGYTATELISALTCIMDALENILENYAYVDTVTQKKALYQVHDSHTGEALLNSAFDQTVSLLDNAYLLLGLHIAESWTADVAPDLSERITSVSAQFDLGMWMSGDTIHIGAPNDPLAGPVFDRFVSETRIVPVLALARGELTFETFGRIIRKSIFQSSTFDDGNVGRSPLQPYFGSALEVWVPTIFLPVELKTDFGYRSLNGLVRAWTHVSDSLGLPGPGPMGIGDGLGGFKVFTSSPSEVSNTLQNRKVLIPPATGIMAGTMMRANPLAIEKFKSVIDYLKDVDPTSFSNWGIPNYWDFGTGLVNQDNPLRGTLEIGQANLALLNFLLGGDYINSLLSEKPSWQSASSSYGAVLGTCFLEGEEFAGIGRVKTRGNASMERVLLLDVVGQQVFIVLQLETASEVSFLLWYSNDGPRDLFEVIMDGHVIDTIQTLDSRLPGDDFGSGWNRFLPSQPISLGNLEVGVYRLSLKLIETDGDGCELDVLHFLGEDLNCGLIVSTETDPDSPGTNHLSQNYPNPFSSITNIEYDLPFGIHQAELCIVNSLGQELYSIPVTSSQGRVPFSSYSLPSGSYYYYLKAAGKVLSTKTMVVSR